VQPGCGRRAVSNSIHSYCWGDRRARDRCRIEHTVAAFRYDGCSFPLLFLVQQNGVVRERMVVMPRVRVEMRRPIDVEVRRSARLALDRRDALERHGKHQRASHGSATRGANTRWDATPAIRNPGREDKELNKSLAAFPDDNQRARRPGENQGA
jgi:hypothetical protein